VINDGSRVRYTGHEDGPLIRGDQGSVLVASGHAAHVQWRTGALAGQVTLHDTDTDDIEPLTPRQGAVEDALDDSLDVEGLGTFTARQIYDEGGSEALLNAMADAGRLAAFQEIAEDALALVAERIRTSAAFTTVAVHLDEDEADEMVRLAAAALIRDAYHTP
jgi:riboflavin synthase